MTVDCGNCKANPVDIARETQGTPTAKLIAILQAYGVVTTKDIAAACGLSERGVLKVLAKREFQARPWFRMYNSVLNDPQVQTLPPDVFKSWVNHQCVVAEYPNSVISDADMAWRLRLGIEEWRAHKAALVTAGLVGLDNRSTYEPLDAACDRPAPADWAEIRQRIFERDDFTCRYCGVRGVSLQCDHVIPVSRGGSSDDSNLVTACQPCNSAKRDRIVSIEEWSSKRRTAL